MKLSDKAYTILKWCALIALPAVGVAYKAISNIWGAPYGDEVAQTCQTAALFIGTLIGVSTAEYYRTKEE